MSARCETLLDRGSGQEARGPGVAARPTLLTHGLCPQTACIQSHPVIRLPTCLWPVQGPPLSWRVHLPVGFGR